MKSVTYVGVDGSVWPLTARDHEGVFLQATPDELRAEGDGGPIAGSLDLVVADNSPEGEDLEPVWVTERAWRRAWSVREFGTLRVDDGEGSDHWLRVRLSVPISGFPEVSPEGFVEFSQAVVADVSVWSRRFEFVGSSVLVANSGDVDVWPRVRWGLAGELTMPSGAVVQLPEVPSPRTILLDPSESCAVVDDSGVVDEPVWKGLRGKVFPEMIPAGQAREFQLPEGATLIVHEGVVSPW
ncbi:hypothetical protein [uncultured Corynebacterium sp.]|uniref:hypothetical protein n=1 Tax=uncultured Corynebacterium sp. TaxID=159447 RepID=UPI00259996E3|nr:hypothetical protein [uncultured Corynebacterium sp.]